MKNIIRISFVLVLGLMVSGCVPKPEVKENPEGTPIVQNTTQNNNGGCKEESVAITGYGDKGKRLKNCFVEYPGEPSRQDKS